MNLLEYQAKKIFDQYGIPIPKGIFVSNPSELESSFCSLASNKIMVKAQVPSGGRGKRGWVHQVDSPAQARETFQKILNSDLQGLKIHGVLVEEAIDFEEELYLGITIDTNIRKPVLLYSPKGGVDVEELVEKYPDTLGQFAIDPFLGVREYQVREILFKLNSHRDLLNSIFDIAKKLFRAFSETDSILTEINPLALTKDNKLVALDAKISLDENALFRHPDLKKEVERTFLDDLEEQLKRDYKIEFVDLKGDIGIVSGGAGMTMTTMDLVLKHGGTPACFMDAAKVITPDALEKAIRTVLGKDEVQSILFNMFGGLTRMDEVATCLVEALRRIGKLEKPIIIRLEGTNADKGREILSSQGKINFESLEEAVKETINRGKSK